MSAAKPEAKNASAIHAFTFGAELSITGFDVCRLRYLVRLVERKKTRAHVSNIPIDARARKCVLVSPD